MKERILKLSRLFSDKAYLQLRYYAKFRKWINWNNPQTFSEKLQWLKVYDRRAEYTIMVDKVEAKKYVASLIGEEYIIPTLGVWKNAEEIDFQTLPEKFVLKCNHDSGNVIICKNKKTLDVKTAKGKLNSQLKKDFYLLGREWPYKNVPRRILAEKFMGDESSEKSDLRDFKFYCFNGKPKYCQVISDRNTDEKIDFYDMEWQRIEGLVGLNPKAHNSKENIEKPRSFNEMKGLVSKLAEKINAPFCRIDFYDVEGKPYFGEITFYPASGFGKFSPDEWNIKMGDYIRLPYENINSIR